MKDNMTAKLFEALHEANEDSFYKNKKSILEMTASEVIEEEAEGKSYRMCPRCGKPFSGYPAISRYDNETEICPDCGVEEAMVNYTGGTLEAPDKYKDEARKYNEENKVEESVSSDEINEEVTIDTPTQEDLDKDDANIKALDKKQIEDKIGELRLAIEDGAISDDEKEDIKKELAELENKLLEEESKNANKDCKKKQLKEDSYEEPFFAEIEDALTNAGFDVTRYSDAGMLTSNLGWIVSNSEGEVNLTCAGTYLTESDDEEEKNSDETCEDKKEISNAKSFDEVIDLLIADEEEAIDGYNEAIEKLKELDEKEKEKLIDMLSHIRDEEEEHIDELENKEIEEEE